MNAEHSRSVLTSHI